MVFRPVRARFVWFESFSSTLRQFQQVPGRAVSKNRHMSGPPLDVGVLTSTVPASRPPGREAEPTAHAPGLEAGKTPIPPQPGTRRNDSLGLRAFPPKDEGPPRRAQDGLFPPVPAAQLPPRPGEKQSAAPARISDFRVSQSAHNMALFARCGPTGITMRGATPVFSRGRGVLCVRFDVRRRRGCIHLRALRVRAGGHAAGCARAGG